MEDFSIISDQMLEYNGSKCTSRYLQEQLYLIPPLTVLATKADHFDTFRNEMALIWCLALAVLDLDIFRAHNSKNCCFSDMSNWLIQCSCSILSVVRSATFYPLPCSVANQSEIWLYD